MIVYGKNVLNELINTNKIKKAYVYKEMLDREFINSLDCPIKYCDKKELDRLSDYGLHQGIVVEIEDYKYCDIDNLDSELLVILDHIEDPHNFGAIIRTCEAAGIKGIIIPKDRQALVNATVMKTSVGTLNNVNIAMVTNLNQAIRHLKDIGYWIVGTDLDGTDYTEIDYKGKTAIVIGNEGSGMSRLVHDSCDFIATIPMNGTTNSLNASVATGIIIFEAIKKRR